MLPKEFKNPDEYLTTLDRYVVAINMMYSMRDWAIAEEICEKNVIDNHFRSVDDWNICRDISILSKHGKITNASRLGTNFIVAAQSTGHLGMDEFWYHNYTQKLDKKLFEIIKNIEIIWVRFLVINGYDEGSLTPPSHPKFCFPYLVPR